MLLLLAAAGDADADADTLVPEQKLVTYLFNSVISSLLPCLLFAAL